MFGTATNIGLYSHAILICRLLLSAVLFDLSGVFMWLSVLLLCRWKYVGVERIINFITKSSNESF